MILYPVQGLLFKYTLALLSEINKLHPPLKDFSTFQSILLWKKSRNQQKTPKIPYLQALILGHNIKITLYNDFSSKKGGG